MSTTHSTGSHHSVRKVRFGIILKLSLFVIIIQLVVLISLGTALIDKESRTLKKNIHLQVSAMMNSFRERLITTASRINDRTLRLVSGNRTATALPGDSISGNEFTSLNEILKNYTDVYNEEESDTRFRVSEIMVVSDHGWIISHSRDDRWLDQHQSAMSQVPQAPVNGISWAELDRMNSTVSDEIPNDMQNQSINGVEYFTTDFPVYLHDPKTFHSIPALINTVDTFQLINNQFTKKQILQGFKPDADILRTLQVFDKILFGIYHYIDIAPERPSPVKFTKLGEAMLKANLLTFNELNLFRETSDMVVKYVRQKWFYSILFKQDFEEIVSSIDNAFKNQYVENFVMTVRPIITDYIQKIKKAGDENKILRMKELVQEIINQTEYHYDNLSAKFPSVARMSDLEKRIRIFTQDIGERGRSIYTAGMEPYDKYIKPFREHMIKCLNAFSEAQSGVQGAGNNVKKTELFENLNKALEAITEKVPKTLKEHVLTPIKIEFTKYVNSQTLNPAFLTATAHVLKLVKIRLKYMPIPRIVTTINQLRPFLTEELLKEFIEVLKEKQDDEAKARLNRMMRQNMTDNAAQPKPKDKWELIVEDIAKNPFFKKQLRIIGERTEVNFSEEQIQAMPFYAMLFMVKQFWRGFTVYDVIRHLKTSFDENDRISYRSIHKRRHVLNLIAPFLKPAVADYLRYRENNIYGFQSEAIRAMHAFSVEDIARLYPHVAAINHLIYSWDKAVETSFWKESMSFSHGNISLNKKFITQLSVSLLQRYKIAMVVLRVRKEQYETFIRRARNTTIDYSASIMLRTILLSIIFSSIFLKSLKSLMKGVDEIAAANFDNVIIIKGSDEFGQLADSLNNMALELKEKGRMQYELSVAKTIQDGLIPKSTPNIPGFSFAGYYQAQTETGGDYYDYLTHIGKDHIGLVVADVSGHGVGAGLVMTMIRSVLRSSAETMGRASNVLKKINPIIYRDTSPNMYATMWYAILNTKTKVLNYSVAGHNAAIIYNPKKKTFHLLKTGGMPVGLQDSEVFDPIIESHAIQLQEGDILVQTTDGVTEAMNSDYEEYGEERLYACVKRMGNLPAEKIVNAIVDDIKKFTGDIPQSDDITLLVMKVED